MLALMSKHSRRIRRRHSGERAGVLVEFSISALFLLLLILSSVQLLYMAYMALAVQFVSLRGLRVAVIGSDTQTPAEFTAALQDQIQSLGRNLGVELAAEDIAICPLRDFHCETPNAGSGNELIVVRVQKRIPFIVFSGLKVSGQAIGRNEPT